MKRHGFYDLIINIEKYFMFNSAFLCVPHTIIREYNTVQIFKADFYFVDGRSNYIKFKLLSK
jgi:hypothetical protein